jgi:hypothetical protein
MLLNYTAQDISGTTLAFLLFPLIFVFPGFVTAWLLNLFEFKQRSLLVQTGIAIVISFSICPIFIFLGWRLVSFEFICALLSIVFLGFVVIFLKQARQQTKHGTNSNYFKWAVAAILFWVVFTILSLTDLQLNNRLYYSVVSIDYTTRVSITDAIARTGVPPINPNYYPGHPALLTSLYYFWYIQTGFIDKIAGNWINGRNAMAASAAWAGLGLMAAIALYIRLRSPMNSAKPWRQAFIGIGSLAIGGLDIIPNLILLISIRLALGKFLFDGIIEHWNEQIATWLTSIFWDPHHVASLIVCVTALMLLQNATGQNRRHQIIAMTIAGIALASAFGLSVWVIIVFCSFWAVWFLYLVIFKKQYFLASLMVFSGVIALILAYPFMKDLLQGLGNSTAFPLAFKVRTFNFAIPWIGTLPELWQSLIHLILLPFNYLLELGYFFIAAILWLRYSKRAPFTNEIYAWSEILLLTVTFFLASFVKSTVILNNDFGWRAWLPGQFVVLIWSTDVLHKILATRKISLKNIIKIPRIVEKVNPLLSLFLIIGILTTIANSFYLKAWPLIIDAGLTLPHMLSVDTNLGERTYAAKQLYNYINKNVPANKIIQNNPTINLDRPLGLYGDHQAIINNITAYGIPEIEYNYYIDQVKPIFLTSDATSWVNIDQLCQKNLINFIVVADEDQLWPNLKTLERQRKALFENSYYAFFNCGDLSSANSTNP